MVEVKNIVNREITGIPKPNTGYKWILMKFAPTMRFLETRFIEYDSYDEFITDGTFSISSDSKIKVLCHYSLMQAETHITSMHRLT